MHIKGMVSKGLRALSHTKKSTKIINLKCTFVVSYNLLMFNYMAYFCFFQPETPPHPGSSLASLE